MGVRAGQGFGDRRPRLLIGRILVWLAVLALARFLSRTEVEDRSLPMRELPAPPDSTGTFEMDHRWSEPQSVEGRQTRMSFHGDFPYADLAFMGNTFGIPEDWLRGADGRADGLASDVPRRAAEQGVRVVRQGDGFQVAPDYRWIIDHSRDDVATVAGAVQRILRERGLESQRDLHRVVASFVQSIEYAIPEPERLNRAGRTVWTLGIATPIEVLHNLWGDCDSKSLLFASILENFRGQRIAFLIGDDHLFVGVRGIPRRGDSFVSLGGVRYVLIEMTDLWPVGRLPDDLRVGVRRHEYEIVTP